MSKKIVAWHIKQVINIEKLEDLELFAESIEATVDVPFSPEPVEEIEVSIFVENGENLDIDVLKEELEKITDVTPEIIPVHDQDWQESSVNSFPPIEIGQFFIHSFDEECEDDSKISLKIPAQMAFGTGEHSTTKGCLVLYQNLKNDDIDFNNILDMGCGSAILAMAASKIDVDADILGVDIDETSIDIAKENLKVNNIDSNLELMTGDGFEDEIVQSKVPYDLIFANILKNPLLDMAEDIYNAVAENGFVILSGFKEEGQRDEIVNKYVNELGLEWVDSFVEDSWSAITLVKVNN